MKLRTQQLSKGLALLLSLVCLLSFYSPAMAGPGEPDPTAPVTDQDTYYDTELLLNSQSLDIPASPDADNTPPVINVWYGNHQVFGQIGTPQQWINILGNASDNESSIISVTYTLNGTVGMPLLRLGSDERRLQNPGDFNIEIDKAVLVEGSNEVIINATNGANLKTTTTVTVLFSRSRIWHLPYAINWSSVTNPQDVLQIVDGLWEQTASGIHVKEWGYDRILAIGDVDWDDFEVTVPVTIHQIDVEAYNSEISKGPGLGITMRWQGHTDDPIGPGQCPQPHCGWEPVGASNWYEWRNDQPDILRISASDANSPSTYNIQFELGHTYWFKARVAPDQFGRSVYRLKVWENAVAEPANWTLVTSAQTAGISNLQKGSLLLIAHHVDATFGNISIISSNTSKYQLEVQTTGDGRVERSPEQAVYSKWQQVSLTAIPDPGWRFAGWSGAISGNSSTETLTMTGDKVVVASFERDGNQLMQINLPIVFHNN